MNVFVYYKLIQSEHPHLQSRIKTMQMALKAQFPALRCDLMKRPETDVSGYETWMEIYHLTDIDVNAFRKRLDQLALDADLPQPRRNEVFVPV